MKQHLIILLIILPAIAFGQYQYGTFREMFFGRQPSARAEAMGKGYCSIDGDMTSIFFNPAGTATLNGLELDVSQSSPYYLLEKAKYSFISIGYKIKNYLIVGLSSNHFNYGEMVYLTSATGEFIDSSLIHNSIYTLTISSQPFKNFYLGLNTNYFLWDIITKKVSTVYFDFGIIKKFQFFQGGKYPQSINVGASIINLTNSHITVSTSVQEDEIELPVIARFGSNYRLSVNKHLLIDNLKTFEFLFHGEYKLLLNSEYLSGIHTGLEVCFMEILFLRTGYYIQKENDFDIPESNKDEISAFTYGFGLQIPIYKLTRIPLQINFDYTTLPQPSYSKTFPDFDNFTTYNVQLNWIISD